MLSDKQAVVAVLVPVEHAGGVADRLLAGLNDYFAIEDRIESLTTAPHQRD